ncbi:hypothetical protein [Terasakiella sp. SH-1]|uniref:hypothetical protein n=1 Tax=Terasakiella sp. SH-1 TaxID=2560057 RepID=UPI0010744B6A|nr:hypothetical protein [Terasakiella sp. SH-1]
MANDPKDQKEAPEQEQFDMLAGSEPEPKPKAAPKKPPAKKTAEVRDEPKEDSETESKPASPKAPTKPKATPRKTATATKAAAKKVEDDKAAQDKPAAKKATTRSTVKPQATSKKEEEAEVVEKKSAAKKETAKTPTKARTASSTVKSTTTKKTTKTTTTKAKPKPKAEPVEEKKEAVVEEKKPEPISPLLMDAFNVSPWAGALMGQGAQPIIQPDEIIKVPEAELIVEEKPQITPETPPADPVNSVSAEPIHVETVKAPVAEEKTVEKQPEPTKVEAKAEENKPEKTVEPAKVQEPAKPVFKNASGATIDSPWKTFNNEPAQQTSDSETITYKAHAKPVEPAVVIRSSTTPIPAPAQSSPPMEPVATVKRRLKRGERKAMRAENIEHWLHENGDGEIPTRTPSQPTVGAKQPAAPVEKTSEPAQKPKASIPWREPEAVIPPELAKVQIEQAAAKPRVSKRKKPTAWDGNPATETKRLSERLAEEQPERQPQDIAVEGMAIGIINALGDGVEAVVDTAKGAVASIGEQPTRHLDKDEVLVENIARGTVDALGSGVEAIVDAGTCAVKGIGMGIDCGVQSVKGGVTRIKNAGSGAAHGFVDGIKKPTSSKD